MAKVKRTPRKIQRRNKKKKFIKVKKYKGIPLILLLHIPKTAGTTMHGIIEEQYPSGIVGVNKGNLLEVIKEVSTDYYNSITIRCIYGHFNYGVHKYVTRPFTYISLLRDPVERVISEYYFLLRNPKHDPYVANEIKMKNMSLLDYVSSTDKAFLFRTSNMQTRFISGKPFPQLKDFMIAKNNIKKHFLLGITERFNESLFLFQKKLGWKPIHSYKSIFVAKDRPMKLEISMKVLNVIREKNNLDLLLYEHAKKIFQEQLESLDPSGRELKQFIKNLKK